jgi:ABC-2 type transport system permease protein
MSGSLIPLSFFPKWLINITYFFPFRTFIYFPADILLSERSTQYFILNIVIGLFWLILLTIISKLLFNKGVTQLQGNLS